jgi:hypothetical protein
MGTNKLDIIFWFIQNTGFMGTMADSIVCKASEDAAVPVGLQTNDGALTGRKHSGGIEQKLDKHRQNKDRQR